MDPKPIGTSSSRDVCITRFINWELVSIEKLNDSWSWLGGACWCWDYHVECIGWSPRAFLHHLYRYCALIMGHTRIGNPVTFCIILKWITMVNLGRIGNSVTFCIILKWITMVNLGHWANILVHCRRFRASSSSQYDVVGSSEKM